MIRCAEESFNKNNEEIAMNEKKYFTYDSEWGFELFYTSEEAQEEAQRRLNSCLDNNEGWAEWTDSICWGEITKKAVEVKGEPVVWNGEAFYSYDYILDDLR